MGRALLLPIGCWQPTTLQLPGAELGQAWAGKEQSSPPAEGGSRIVEGWGEGRGRGGVGSAGTGHGSAAAAAALGSLRGPGPRPGGSAAAWGTAP